MAGLESGWVLRGMWSSAREVGRLASRAAPRALRLASRWTGAAGSAEKVQAPTQGRAERALDLVRRIEAHEPSLPAVAGSREFIAHDRALAARDFGEATSELVPRQLRSSLAPGSDDVREVSAAVAADVIALAKFDLAEQPKLRAHYMRDEVTMATQPKTPGGRDGIGNAVRAHEVVSTHAPGLCPRLVNHGTLDDGVRYLVEEWVDGTPLTKASAFAEAIPLVLAGLARVHRGHGVAAQGLTERFGTGFAERWEETRATDVVPAALAEQIAGLIAAERQVRVSWTHGDLVPSNVLRTPDGGVVLIDWEMSKEAILMLDAAKLHLASAVPEQTLDQVLDLLREPTWSTTYSPVEELALAHAHLLTRYPSRRAQLEGHPRAKGYERQTRKQVERMAQALARAT